MNFFSSCTEKLHMDGPSVLHQAMKIQKQISIPKYYIMYEYVTFFGPHVLDFGLVYLLFYITFIDISVIYVSALHTIDVQAD